MGGVHLVERGGDDGRRVQRLEPQASGESGIELVVAGQLGDDGVELALVPLVARGGLPSCDQRGGDARRVPEPTQERGVRVAGRHHDGRLHDIAIGQLDAAYPFSLTGDGDHTRRRSQRAAGSLEGAEHGVGHGAAAAHGPADGSDVLHRERECAQAGTGGMGRQTPHRRSHHHRRRHDRVLAEEASEHLGHRAPAPADEVTDAVRPPVGDAPEDVSRGRHVVGQLDQ